MGEELEGDLEYLVELAGGFEDGLGVGMIVGGDGIEAATVFGVEGVEGREPRRVLGRGGGLRGRRGRGGLGGGVHGCNCMGGRAGWVFPGGGLEGLGGTSDAE